MLLRNALLSITALALVGCQSTQEELKPLCRVDVGVIENLSNAPQHLKEGTSLYTIAAEVMRLSSPEWLSLRPTQEPNQDIEIEFVRAYTKRLPSAVSGNLIFTISSDLSDSKKYLRGLAVKETYWTIESQAEIFEAAFKQSFTSVVDEIAHYCDVQRETLRT